MLKNALVRVAQVNKKPITIPIYTDLSYVVKILGKELSTACAKPRVLGTILELSGPRAS